MKKHTVKKAAPAPVEEAKQAMAQIPVDILNQVLGYLSEKPFKEVQSLIGAIQKNSELI